MFEFREVFYRSTGLSNAVANTRPDPPTHELFNITGHPSKALATRCLARRNHAKLERHLVSSQIELAELVSNLVTTEAASKVSDLLSDLFKDNKVTIEPSRYNLNTNLSVEMPKRTVASKA